MSVTHGNDSLQYALLYHYTDTTAYSIMYNAK